MLQWKLKTVIVNDNTFVIGYVKNNSSNEEINYIILLHRPNIYFCGTLVFFVPTNFVWQITRKNTSHEKKNIT